MKDEGNYVCEVETYDEPIHQVLQSRAQSVFRKKKIVFFLAQRGPYLLIVIRKILFLGEFSDGFDPAKYRALS